MSASMVQAYQPSTAFQQPPHRKPLPPDSPARPQSMQLRPEELEQQYTAPSHLPPQMQMQPGSRMSYSSTSSARPSSSVTLTGVGPPSSYSYNQAQAPQMQNQAQNQYMPTTKRTLSNATTSTSSTSGTTKVNSSASSTLQRSTSARSNQPTSYVALMRKQKATVWCDRAQQEDPRVLAQQRLAKQRAVIEVSSASTASRTSTSNSSMIRSKMRHHGAPKAQQYTPDSHPASGVPMRLSAREVEEDGSDDDNYNARGGNSYHQRSGSGRSSVGSGRVGSTHTASHGAGGLAAPSGGSRTSSVAGASPIGTRSPNNPSTTSSPQKQHQEYFTKGSSGIEDDEELSFGGFGGLPQRRRLTDEEEARKQDLADLRRRGSVDEKTMTLSGYGRLYVANPDLD